MSKRLSGMNKLLVGGSAALAIGVLSGCGSETAAQAPAPAETSAPAQPSAETCSKLGQAIAGHDFILGMPDENYAALQGGDTVKAPEIDEDASYIVQHYATELATGALPADTIFEIQGLAKTLDDANILSTAASDMSLTGMTHEATAGQTFTPPEGETWTRAFKVVPHNPLPADAPCTPKFIPVPSTSV